MRDVIQDAVPKVGQVWHDKEYPDLLLDITDVRDGEVEWHDMDLDGGWMTVDQLLDEYDFRGIWWSFDLQKDAEESK